jgi:hypothetical protein
MHVRLDDGALRIVGRRWPDLRCSHGVSDLMSDIFFIAVVAWGLAIVAHWAYECFIIYTRGIDELPVCRRWWCPDGFLNHWKGNR